MVNRLLPRARLWPSDKAVLAYFALMCAMELLWFQRIPEAWWLISLHVAGALMIFWISGVAPSDLEAPNHAVWVFRNWYPVLFVASCYREMAFIIADLRLPAADRLLDSLDFAFWGAHPTIWLERLYHPALTEFLQLVYTLFVPVALFVPWLMWRWKRYDEFRYMTFLLALGFLASYLGYILVPARGPRFLLEHLQNMPLQGLLLFGAMQDGLNRLEKDHYDCFPSGHTEITVLAWSLSRAISRRAFYAYFLYTLCIVFATVYLRYHYTVDLLAGVVVALILIVAAPVLYRGLSEKGDSIGD